jgi:flagellar hook-associated protein 3 FlgL
MRVTTFGVNAQYMSDLNNIMSKYQDLEQQLSTGSKLNQPSDDPVAFESDIQAQTSITQVGQWSSNAAQASDQMKSADSAFSALQSTLGNLRTSLVGALNGTNKQSDYDNMLPGVTQQILAVAQTANTSDGQQYVFTGANGKVPTQPIDSSSGQLVWTAGKTPAQNATIGNNVSLERSVDGEALFNKVPPGKPGSTSLIDTLNQISTDMKAASTAPNDAALQTAVQGLSNDLSKLDDNIDNVSAMRSDLGGRMGRVDAMQTQLTQTTNLLTQQKGKAEDADLAQVMTQLTTQQTVYQAALMSGQKLILPTLADVLK